MPRLVPLQPRLPPAICGPRLPQRALQPTSRHPNSKQRLRESAMQASRCSAFEACGRQEVANAIQHSYDDLGGLPPPDRLPIVYSDVYNISFWGVENLHPLDSKKFGKIVGLLEEAGLLTRGQLTPAAEATREALLDVHEVGYLDRLERSSLKVAWVTELAPLAFLPASLLRRKVLRPMRFMAGGTMLAAALAMRHGWAVNLGGGMHHAWHGDGGGWCAYDDIVLAARRLRAASGGAARRFMVIDLDVHQGNGVGRDKLRFASKGGGDGGLELCIVDVYNAQIYPRDEQAKQAIDVREELCSGAADAEYLAAVERALAAGFRACPHPDLVFFNAGTDILEGDRLGRLCVTAAGVRARDEAVWAACAAARAPLVMTLSGGYTRASTPCIYGSLRNLAARFGLFGPQKNQQRPTA